MMVVDASALVAILLREDDAEVYRDALLASPETRLSPIGYWEAATRLQSFRGLAGVNDLDRLLAQLAIEIAPATAATAFAPTACGKRLALHVSTFRLDERGLGNFPGQELRETCPAHPGAALAAPLPQNAPGSPRNLFRIPWGFRGARSATAAATTGLGGLCPPCLCPRMLVSVPWGRLQGQH